MSGLAEVVLAVAVVALVLARQLRPRKVADGRSGLILPAVLAFVALRQGGLTDPHHQAASVALFAVELVIAAAMGTVWAFTTRIWRDEAGEVWVKGTKATAVAWVGGILLRVGLAAVGAMLGVREGSGSLMLAVAATLLVRTGVVVWRASRLTADTAPAAVTP